MIVILGVWAGEHRRLEIWDDSGVVISWVNGEHAEVGRRVVEQIVEVAHGWRISAENRRG